MLKKISYNYVAMAKTPGLKILNILLMITIAMLLLPGKPVQAQSYSAYDLIAAVNSLRSQYGL